MLEALGVVFAIVAGVTIAAALIYIGGFVISMFASLIGSISDASTHHHHHAAMG